MTLLTVGGILVGEGGIFTPKSELKLALGVVPVQFRIFPENYPTKTHSVLSACTL